MAKQKKPDHITRPANNRFDDWSFGPDSNVIWHNANEQLVPNDDNGDPAPIANQPPKDK